MKLAQLALPLCRSRLVRSGKGLKPIESMKTLKALFGIVTITAAFAIQVHAQSFLTNGLAAYYPFSGNANDASGHGMDGVVHGAALTTDRFGSTNSAYRFNGSSWIQLPDAILPVAASAVTLSAWVLADSGPYTTQEHLFLQTSRRGNWGCSIVVPAAAQAAQFGFGAKLQDQEFYSVYSPLITNVWLQIVGIYQQGQYMQLWVNGSLVQSNGIPDERMYTDPTDQLNSAIGIYDWGTSPYLGFSGAVDDVRIYNRTLSDSEVQQLYAYESATSCASPPAGLVSWWPGQGNANDITGTNNGTQLSGATFAPGEVGSAFSFNGSNQCVQVPYSQSLVGPIYSVEAWIEPLSQPSGALNQAVIFGQSFGRSLLIARPGNSGVVILFGFGTSHVTFNWAVSTNEIPIGQFSHLVGTWDGTTLRLYVNGALNAQNTPGTSPVDPGCPFFIGGFYTVDDGSCNYEGQFFNGLIDEVSYYNRALAGAEIQALYAAGSAGKCPPPLTDCVPPPSGLVSWWSGEGNANDIAGPNNGNLSGGVTFTNGEVGQAFSFNGTNTYVKVPDSPSLRLTHELTIEFWVRRQDLQANDVIVEKGGDFTRGVQNYGVGIVRAQEGNYLSFWFAGGVRESISITDLNWHHIAVVAHNGDADPTFYVDGVPQPVTRRVGPGTLVLYPSTAALHIGAQVDPISGWNYYSKALVDEVSIYNRALAASEIQSIYTAGSAGKCVPQPPNCIPPPSGLVGWWPGEGDAGDIAGTNNGALLNGATFAPGEVGQAFSFNRGLDSVVVPDSSSLRLTTNLTIEAWIKTRSTTIGQPQVIVSKVGISGGNNGYALYLSEQNTLSAEFNRPGQSWPGNVISYGNTSAIVSNVWYHVAWTYDQSAMKLYLNGLPVATNVIGPQAIAVSTNSLRISGVDENNQVFFGGLIDEPSVYNRPLSASEIAAIYNAGSEGKCRVAPTARTATATATVVNDFVVGATITDRGYGYTNTPTVKIIGGGGNGAQAVAVVSNGVVVAIRFLDAGSGYTSTPLIVIDPPFFPNPVLDIAPMSFLVFSNLTLGGAYQLQQSVGWYWSNQPVSFTATNALYTQMVAGVADNGDYRLALNPVPAQAFATAQVVNGFVVGATVTSGGSGYVTSPAVTIVGAGGTNATAISHISGGVVTSVAIIDAGSGYTNAPTVRIAPPAAAAVSPTVLPVMRVDSANLAPYDNYQIQFKSDLGGAWGNWNGGLFSPTDVTNSQYLFITNGVGFFRLQYVP